MLQNVRRQQEIIGAIRNRSELRRIVDALHPRLSIRKIAKGPPCFTMGPGRAGGEVAIVDRSRYRVDRWDKTVGCCRGKYGARAAYLQTAFPLSGLSAERVGEDVLLSGYIHEP